MSSTDGWSMCSDSEQEADRTRVSEGTQAWGLRDVGQDHGAEGVGSVSESDLSDDCEQLMAMASLPLTPQQATLTAALHISTPRLAQTGQIHSSTHQLPENDDISGGESGEASLSDDRPQGGIDMPPASHDSLPAIDHPTSSDRSDSSDNNETLGSFSDVSAQMPWRSLTEQFETAQFEHHGESQSERRARSEIEQHAQDIRRAFSNIPTAALGKRKVTLTVLVVGEAGVGKTALIRTLFVAYGLAAQDSAAVSDDSQLLTPQMLGGAPGVAKQLALQLSVAGVVDEDHGVEYCFRIQEAPGSLTSSSTTQKALVNFIKSQYQQYLDAELDSNHVPGMQDTRVDVCLYLLPPHTLKERDAALMRKLSEHVPVIPLVAKADCMTHEELASFSDHVRTNLREERNRKGEPIMYEFPVELLEEAGASNASSPFAVMGSTAIDWSVGRYWAVRRYPWGIAEAYSSVHANLALLKHLVCDIGMPALKCLTEARYSTFRTKAQKTRTSSSRGKLATGRKRETCNRATASPSIKWVIGAVLQVLVVLIAFLLGMWVEGTWAASVHSNDGHVDMPGADQLEVRLQHLEETVSAMDEQSMCGQEPSPTWRSDFESWHQFTCGARHSLHSNNVPAWDQCACGAQDSVDSDGVPESDSMQHEFASHQDKSHDLHDEESVTSSFELNTELQDLALKVQEIMQLSHVTNSLKGSLHNLAVDVANLKGEIIAVKEQGYAKEVRIDSQIGDLEGKVEEIEYDALVRATNVDQLFNMQAIMFSMLEEMAVD